MSALAIINLQLSDDMTRPTRATFDVVLGAVTIRQVRLLEKRAGGAYFIGWPSRTGPGGTYFTLVEVTRELEARVLHAALEAWRDALEHPEAYDALP